ncbi:MAG: DUF6916 family protein [Rubrobacteraceae bacterium]
MLEGFSARTFSGRLGDAFVVCRDDSGASVELVSVEGEEPEGRPFSAAFRGSGDVPLSQGIHRMEHREIGAFELFLVPVGPDGEGLLYEAVFN